MSLNVILQFNKVVYINRDMNFIYFIISFFKLWIFVGTVLIVIISCYPVELSDSS